MSIVHYKVVPHDGGFAYTFKGSFSETYPTREDALKAARRAARGARTARARRDHPDHVPDPRRGMAYRNERGGRPARDRRAELSKFRPRG
ncbi:DUF2188 domain-containing protein [Acidocella sp.]|uniref:DUF2188 domain-containing protein n=1 Tax=Acidocella sp. TaxID=50710 RepID=UPI003D0910D6